MNVGIIGSGTRGRRRPTGSRCINRTHNGGPGRERRHFQRQHHIREQRHRRATGERRNTQHASIATLACIGDPCGRMVHLSRPTIKALSGQHDTPLCTHIVCRVGFELGKHTTSHTSTTHTHTHPQGWCRDDPNISGGMSQHDGENHDSVSGET